MVKYVKYVNFSNKRRFCAALIRGEALIRGTSLFQCRDPQMRRLLEGGTCLRPGAY